MPAIRTEPRQGSSRPAPHLRQGSVANPRPSATEVVALSSDDELLPRKRLAAEKSSARQRSKQKARGPLPPPSEIIEISSDDDEPPAKRPSNSTAALERRVKELEEENKKWKEAALAAHDAQAQSFTPVKQATPAPDTRFDEVRRFPTHGWQDHAETGPSSYPQWTTMDCLQDWFSTALAQHMAANPQYNPQGIVPHHWRAALARQDLSIIARRQIEREIAMLMDATPQPSYTCPTCRLEVRNKPAENFVVKHLVRTVAGIQGESCPKEDPLPRLGHRLEGHWDGFFPVFRRD
ncbi:hypothetical protein BN946_scf184743.g1 [Trametes cinnabarina]|uniref:Uncharacterized protein n=1 Tax=Pycnoporus cinnabarinus TaxID=5643 RepID=A0A060SN75_PYCCI|nr:hypothetical protein BN946_scf184743.g1 [Trametes cinnabarina]